MCNREMLHIDVKWRDVRVPTATVGTIETIEFGNSHPLSTGISL